MVTIDALPLGTRKNRPKKGLGFHKSHTFIHKEFASGRIITLIALLGRRVANKNTSKGSRIKFIPIVFGNINKSHTPEHFERKRCLKTKLWKVRREVLKRTEMI